MTTPQGPFGTTPHDEDGLVDVDHPVDPAQQERIRSLLSTLPDPGPMPADLVARIQARLDEESLALTPHGSHAGVVDLASRRRRRTGLLAAAAGLVAVAGVGGLALSGIDLTPDGSLAVLDTSHRGTASAGPAAVQVRISGAAVTRGTLAAEGAALLGATFDPPFPLQAESPTVGPLATPRGLGDCLATLGLGDARKVSGELASFETTPALVLGVVESDGHRRAWAVDRACVKLVEPQPIP